MINIVISLYHVKAAATVPNENAVWPKKNRFFSEYASVVSDISEVLKRAGKSVGA
jgi:hypothetical protein